MTGFGGGTLKRRILAAFGIPFLLSLVISVVSVVYLVDNLLLNQVQRKVAADLRSARELYNMRAEVLKDLVRFSANLDSVKKAILKGKKAELNAVLQPIRVRSGEDFLTVADAGARVLVRTRNPSASGDQVGHIAPVKAALIGETSASTEVMDGSDLLLEGEEMALRSRVRIAETPYAAPTDQAELTKGMAIIAAAPITDDSGAIIAVVYAGHLLSRDFSLVDKIRATVFPDQAQESGTAGTATIFLGDVRISTNVLMENGQRAVGTRVSEKVAEKVLRGGGSFFDRAFVVNDWYVSAYEPIRNSRDEVIGILYVGLLEKPYRDLVIHSMLVVGFLQFVGLTAGMLLFTLTVSRIVARPLRNVTEGIKKVAAGDGAQAVTVDSKDELGQLAENFNAMVRNLEARERESELARSELAKKIEEKNAALDGREEELHRSRAEVLDIMEKQKETNLELQQSFERLKETQEELVRSGKLAALGAMAAGVAHEINTPLATIRGNVEIMTLKLKEIPECAEELLHIEQQTDRMQGIVQNLLTFARVEKPYAEPTDIRRALIDVIQSLGPRAVEKNVEILADIPDDLPPVMAAYDKLLQVFNNLCNNALQAMSRGGRLTIAASVDGERGEVRVTFADTGVGIAPQDIPKVWNPFFSTKPAGTGLGLSISHAIIEGFGGKITLVSERGKGATFTVHLSRAL